MTLGGRCSLLMNRRENGSCVGKERKREVENRKPETWVVSAVGGFAFVILSWA